MARLKQSSSWIGAVPVRTLRIVSGAWALALDAAAKTVIDPRAALERVELRGVRVQRMLRRGLRAMERESEVDLGHLADSAAAPVRWVKREISVTGASSAEGMERQVENLLERMGIPSRERLERLSREIEELSLRIDRELQTIEASERKAQR